ncbi:class I histocompatibility antigen, F10 alpha chain-like [Megalops cyprinoides]|uniref:class I histocompatibility antigen, F10 alpha chain-like n=1 Tax=Megalops cyprinoides TaxID=118141 RepID=UPI0018646B5C|nr:class I histocompatibility antigen, F10 alpha chain-like [Megalops cyprinoides]
MTAINTMQFVCTATSGVPDIPEFVCVGMVDGNPFSYYDSNIRRMIPKQEWKSNEVDPHYFERSTHHCYKEEQSFKNNITLAMKQFNQTGGIHTLQNMFGCEWDDETGSTEGYDWYGYDGEDVQAYYVKKIGAQWTATGSSAQTDFKKNFLVEQCIGLLKNYVLHAKSTLKRKVPPEVTLLQKDPSSPVTCHATGFYPRGISVSWQRDGEDLHEDVELGETLPNIDGTFQIRSSLRVSPEDMKIHKYTCTVQHSSLHQDVVKGLHEGEIKRNPNFDNVHHITIVIGVVTALLLSVTAVIGFFVWKRKSGYSKATTSDQGSLDSQSSGGDSCLE